MKTKLFSLVSSLIVIFYFIYLYCTHPNGYLTYYANPYMPKGLHLKPMWDLFPAILYPIVYILMVLVSFVKKNYLTPNLKFQRAYILAWILINFLCFLYLYLMMNHVHWLEPYNIEFIQLNWAILAIFSFVSANHYNSVPFNTPMRSTNKYMEAHPIVWRKFFRLKGILSLFSGIICLGSRLEDFYF